MSGFKRAANCIDIGLVNNMPSAALEATERQFRTLLDTAADDIRVRLRLFALPEVPRTDSGQRHVNSCYSDINDLWDSHLDGLIVTGTEPRTRNLTEEPYWGSLTRLVDWAELHTHSTIWSCLAAHAAVLHTDGISRCRLSVKRFGVFDCARASEHSLTASAPAHLQMPHSRWNEVPEDALTTCGYRILTRSKDAGADAFIKRRRSLFVFFQGHPEYEADTLFLEYRRDVRRFLTRETESYPPMPQGYFNAGIVDALTALQERALSDRRQELLADLPTALVSGRVRNTWRFGAVCIYRNWLRYLCAKRDRRLEVSQGPTEYTGISYATPVAPQKMRALQTLETERGAVREILGSRQIGGGIQRRESY